MMRLETTSKLSNEALITRAMQYFGPGGLGLDVIAQSPTCVIFDGDGGGVEVALASIGAGTFIDVVSQKWDYQTKGFVRGLAH